MPSRPTKPYRAIRLRALVSLVLVSILVVSCNLPAYLSTISGSAPTPPGIDSRIVDITFKATLPQSLAAGDSIYLVLLDEVTGLSFNSHQYIMQAEDSLTYSVTLPFTVGKVLKYRYTRHGASVVEEHLYNDRPVRYRMLDVEGPATFQDVISRWTDTQLTGPTGRIMGKILDHITGKPVSNLLVTAGGEQAFTLADGTFLLEGLPPGTHNLLFYAMDGSYHIFQQGAVVGPDSSTPVALELNSTSLAPVHFTVSVPADTPQDAPLRLAGSLVQLGNTFADLSGGVSTLASRMPLMEKLPDNRYYLTLDLPVGTYIEYKYTLGDGLWSSELTSSGEPKLRPILVPPGGLDLEDTVASWQPPNTKPVTFNVTVPQTTPPGEHVSIQFNPGFGWLEPLPMQPIFGTSGLSQWQFTLTGPFSNLATLHYRYCRQEQCGAADDVATKGPAAPGRALDFSTKPGLIRDTVTAWAWLEGSSQPASVPNVQVTSRGQDFTAGLAFQAKYHPSYATLLDSSIKRMPAFGVNWLEISPTWTFTNNTPPILEPLPSHDMPLPELINSISTAQADGLKVALFPEPNFPSDAGRWWQEATRDFPWWVAFFDRYSNFIDNFATAASTSNTDRLVMGGDWLDPSLPSGLLKDGSSSNVPEDAEARWRDLVKHVRQIYHGKLVWALSYPGGVQNPPPFLDAFDEIFILWSAPLATLPGTTVDQLQAQAASILDQDILPFQQKLNRPVILAIAYPSIDQAATGCIAITSGCLGYDLLSQPNPDIPQLNLNLQAQADAYDAILSAINDRPWISGYISVGYYPPAILQDKSTSIRAKPASGVLLFWSQKYLGK